jgi:cytochrome b involved in lipid metabolism
MSSELKSYSKEEVSKHNSEKDLWVIINNQVYDLSKFAKVHPGGLGVLLPLAGKDCTKQFYALHQEAVLNKYGPKLLIGNLEGQKPILTQNRGFFGLSKASSVWFLTQNPVLLLKDSLPLITTNLTALTNLLFVIGTPKM